MAVSESEPTVIHLRPNMCISQYVIFADTLKIFCPVGTSLISAWKQLTTFKIPFLPLSRIEQRLIVPSYSFPLKTNWGFHIFEIKKNKKYFFKTNSNHIY